MTVALGIFIATCYKEIGCNARKIFTIRLRLKILLNFRFTDNKLTLTKYELGDLVESGEVKFV